MGCRAGRIPTGVVEESSRIDETAGIIDRDVINAIVQSLT